MHHANLWQTTDGSIIGVGANLEYGNVFDVMGRGGIKGQMNAWFQGSLGTLSAGSHTLVIGGFNNKKTTTSESTRLIIDDVILFRP